MTVLELIRTRLQREERLKAAQKTSLINGFKVCCKK